jgi:hypothetical protein
MQLKGVPADIKLPSLDEYLYERETDDPWALSCDTIPRIEFDDHNGRKNNRCYSTDDLIFRPSEKSKDYQKSLDKFIIWNKGIEHYDNIVNRRNFL